MNTLTNTPELALQAQVDRPVPLVPVTEPLHQAEDTVLTIRADILVNPTEYLDEVRVPGGGE